MTAWPGYSRTAKRGKGHVVGKVTMGEMVTDQLQVGAHEVGGQENGLVHRHRQRIHNDTARHVLPHHGEDPGGRKRCLRLNWKLGEEQGGDKSFCSAVV